MVLLVYTSSLTWFCESLLVLPPSHVRVFRSEDDAKSTLAPEPYSFTSRTSGLELPHSHTRAMSAKPEPESGAEKGAKDPREVHFAPSDIKEGVDEDDPEGGESALYGFEYIYPDLEAMCKLSESMSDEEYAQATGKLGPAALCAQRGAGNAAAAAKVVGENRAVGTNYRRPSSVKTDSSPARLGEVGGP